MPNSSGRCMMHCALNIPNGCIPTAIVQHATLTSYVLLSYSGFQRRVTIVWRPDSMAPKRNEYEHGATSLLAFARYGFILVRGFKPVNRDCFWADRRLVGYWDDDVKTFG